jgi:hypothetical protein
MKSIAFTERVYHVPYVPEGRTYAYIDLRTHPSKIDEIPELHSERRLKALVTIRSLITVTITYNSLGCSRGWGD